MWLHKIQRRRDERGSASIEMTLLAPVLIVILLFVVGLGRMAHTRQQLEAVASDAARAASLERNTAASAGAAHAAAKASLGRAGVTCVGLDVDVDLSSYQPGGRVSVTVACTTKLSDLSMAGLPGRKQFTADATVPIETYRGS
ncbi:MAG: TadE/TadG family type IV pilus assembly protein [Pseudonocardiaceae bacterium]